MKTLLVLRHAKSAWKDPRLEDHDRPLSTRGRRDAPRMGELIARLGIVPQQILSSTATRTRETIELVTGPSGFADDLQFDEALYLASAVDIVSVIRRSVARGADRIMVVGHNPGSEELVRRLTREEETMPTAALAQIELPIAVWDELRISTSGRLVALWRPKELG